MARYSEYATMPLGELPGCLLDVDGLRIVNRAIDLFADGATMDDCCNPVKTLERRLMLEYESAKLRDPVKFYFPDPNNHYRFVLPEHIEEDLVIVRRVLQILTDVAFYIEGVD
jgi:hypothetical protein